METKDRIKAILDYYNLSATAFAKAVGVKTSQAVYDLISGKTQTISSSMERKILSCFTEVSRSWLLTGEGDMIKSSSSLIVGDNNQVAGSIVNNGNTHSKTNNTTNNYRDDQCDGLITLQIENAKLKEKVDSYSALIEEKERMIKLLLDLQKAK